MAEGLFKHALTQSNIVNCFVSSAGLDALVGSKPDPSACQLMLERSIDISHHRACQLTTEMVRKADLILVMETDQKIAIEVNEPSARGKVFCLGQWGDVEIADPYQKERLAFERSLILIEQSVSQWIDKLSSNNRN